jgi:hypothetical protein
MRREAYHNTPEQIREYVRDALAVVDELQPPDDLREAVFTAAVNLRAAKQLTLTGDDVAGAGLATLLGPGLPGQ